MNVYLVLRTVPCEAGMCIVGRLAFPLARMLRDEGEDGQGNRVGCKLRGVSGCGVVAVVVVVEYVGEEPALLRVACHAIAHARCACVAFLAFAHACHAFASLMTLWERNCALTHSLMWEKEHLRGK